MAGVSVGQVYGWWTVLGRAENDDPRDCRWLCQCRCGAEYICTTSQLISGKKTHCGCQTTKQGRISDLSGRRFHRLVAIEPLSTRDAKGSVMWRCRCDCGSEVEVSYNILMYSNIRSCGCKKREHDVALTGYLQRVDGTSIDMLKSSKIPRSNTTGVKGVYRSRGKYIAKIVVQGHQYHLGAYSTLQEASAARQEAEETINRQLIRAWEQWRARADQDAAWAEANPFTIRVEKDSQNRISLMIGGI